jgi:pyrimidine-specific ribonucleoside hydrolase
VPIPVILDCDPGHDDALAIMIAVADPDIDLRAITTVAGNVTLENTTMNALRVLDMVGRSDIPVAAGADRPRERSLSTAASMHGESGLAGPLPVQPGRAPSAITAVELIAQVLTEASEPVTLVITGPQTNAAAVIEELPHLRDRIARIVFMGGAIDLGNWTPAAEFNIWVDPEAADIVLRSGLDLTMIGLEVTHQAWLTDEHADALRGKGDCGRFVAELLDHFVGFHRQRFDWEGAPIHDAVTIAHLIDPSLVRTVFANVEIELQSELCVGRTVVDRWRVTERRPNCHVGIGIDRDRFVTLLMDRLVTLTQ